MKNAVLFLALFVVFAGGSLAQSEEALVSVPLENYLKGHTTVDVEYTKKAFHSTGNIMTIRDGAYVSQSFGDYINGLVGRKPAADEDKRKRYIEAVDVVGNAATARVVSDYPSIKYIDYMALLKIDGEWKIVNKIFFAEQKGSNAKIGSISEKDAVRVPLENYIKGQATGDGEYIKKAFHTEGNLIFIREGKYTTRSFAEYIAGMSGKPAADEAKRNRWIDSVDIAGNAATARIILDYPTTRFVDYMALLKIKGEWKIVNKSFHAEPKTKQ
jgi:hypothetical protein